MGAWANKGDQLQVENIGSLAGLVFTARIRIRTASGHYEQINLQFTPDSSRILTLALSPHVFPEDGEVVMAQVNIISGAPKRGQVYVILALHPNSQVLAQGYVYVGHAVNLGEYVEPESFLRWDTVFHDRAGNAAVVDYPLAATGMVRKVLGVAWYYHCNGTVASRSFTRPYLAGLGGTKPTGFTLTGANALVSVLGSANLTLTADEEGEHLALAIAGKDGFMASVDNGAGASAPTSTAPCPFPLIVTEVETDAIIRFPAITSGVATDTHSAYVLLEEEFVL